MKHVDDDGNEITEAQAMDAVRKARDSASKTPEPLEDPQPLEGDEFEMSQDDFLNWCDQHHYDHEEATRDGWTPLNHPKLPKKGGCGRGSKKQKHERKVGGTDTAPPTKPESETDKLAKMMEERSAC